MSVPTALTTTGADQYQEKLSKTSWTSLLGFQHRLESRARTSKHLREACLSGSAFSSRTPVSSSPLPQPADQQSMNLTNVLHLAQMILEQDTGHCTLPHLSEVFNLPAWEMELRGKLFWDPSLSKTRWIWMQDVSQNPQESIGLASQALNFAHPVQHRF